MSTLPSDYALIRARYPDLAALNFSFRVVPSPLTHIRARRATPPSQLEVNCDCMVSTNIQAAHAGWQSSMLSSEGKWKNKERLLALSPIDFDLGPRTAELRRGQLGAHQFYTCTHCTSARTSRHLGFILFTFAGPMFRLFILSTPTTITHRVSDFLMDPTCALTARQIFLFRL